MPRFVTLGSRKVGDEYPAYIVAEIGINHNGDMDLAKHTIEAAKTAGADAVKFQNYRTEDFVPTQSETHTYVSHGQTITESQYDMFKRYELSDAALVEIADHCGSVGIDFHSTPTNRDGIALLKRIGAYVLKNGSDYLSNLPLIEAMARSGLPTVLSTGMATFEEIEEAVSAFEDAGGKDLIILHCVSQYPAPVDQLRLRRMTMLRQRFPYLVGFSDHSVGETAAVLAVAMGACWIEKHFTLDKVLEGPDHSFSSDPKEMRRLVDEVRGAEQALHFAPQAPLTQRETESRLAFRLSCAASRDIEAGETLTESDITFFRPGTGYAPKEIANLVGRKIVRPARRGQLFSEAMFA